MTGSDVLNMDAFTSGYLNSHKPVLLRGLAATWPALNSWPRLGHIEHACGPDRPVLCERNLRTTATDLAGSGRLFSYGSTDESVTLPLSEVLSALRGGQEQDAGTIYAAQIPIDELGAALRGDIIMPPHCGLSPPSSWSNPASILASLLPSRPPPDIHVWLGASNSVSPLHFDMQHNLLVQVVGRKHALLFDPNTCAQALYPCNTIHYGGPSNQSALGERAQLLGVAGVDMAAFPEFANARPLEAIIHPGDALFIPAGYWHHVAALPGSLRGVEGEGYHAISSRASDESVFSVNFWWQ